MSEAYWSILSQKNANWINEGKILPICIQEISVFDDLADHLSTLGRYEVSRKDSSSCKVFLGSFSGDDKFIAPIVSLMNSGCEIPLMRDVGDYYNQKACNQE